MSASSTTATERSKSNRGLQGFVRWVVVLTKEAASPAAGVAKIETERGLRGRRRITVRLNLRHASIVKTCCCSRIKITVLFRGF